MFCTKNNSDVLMSSPLLLKTVLHICMELMRCDKVVGSRIARVGVSPTSCKMGQLKVDLQHGAVVEGNSHPCIKGHYVK